MGETDCGVIWMMLLKCCIHHASKFGNLSSDHRTGWGQFSFQSSKKKKKQCHSMFKLPHNCTSHMQAKQCSKFPARLQQFMNQELPDSQTRFTKRRRTRDKLPTSIGSLKNQESFRKTSTSALLTMPSLYCVDHNKLWKILKEMGIPGHLSCLLRNLYAGQEVTVWTRHGTQTGSKLGKECIKAVYCHLTYSIYMQSTSWYVWLDEA